jgi:hypothetical protein
VLFPWNGAVSCKSADLAALQGGGGIFEPKNHTISLFFTPFPRRCSAADRRAPCAKMEIRYVCQFGLVRRAPSLAFVAAESVCGNVLHALREGPWSALSRRIDESVI